MMMYYMPLFRTFMRYQVSVVGQNPRGEAVGRFLNGSVLLGKNELSYATACGLRLLKLGSRSRVLSLRLMQAFVSCLA